MFRLFQHSLPCIALLVMLGTSAAIHAGDALPDVENQKPALPNVRLVGVVIIGNDLDQAIVQLDGGVELLYWLDAVDDIWWLDAIAKDYILLTDGERFARVDLYHGRPTEVSGKISTVSGSSDRLQNPLFAITPPGPEVTFSGAIHTAATHVNLAPGQRRQFYLPAQQLQDESLEHSSMALWQAEQDEINNPGMARRFSNEPVIEIGEHSETVGVTEFDGHESRALEAGQSRRFGTLPLTDLVSFEE